ncbi:MAG: hypothetical protein HQK97_02675 [Nitrospirae bacterium]|nr:hypothetical protein [Nitrospirota bacterium]
MSMSISGAVMRFNKKGKTKMYFFFVRVGVAAFLLLIMTVMVYAERRWSEAL